MNTLCLDIGSGTQDVLFSLEGESPQNWPKFVLPSPARRVGERIRRLAETGIPVCAHLGLKPQQVHKLGRYRVHGRDPAEAEVMDADARALEAAGADLLILECVPASLAEQLARTLTVPVVGIGAGAACDGQILVLHDALGVTGRPPRFARDFAAESSGVQAALGAYVEAVKARTFPGPEHGFEA